MSVIINADDFGMNERCTKAIAEAFSKGLVTDTTMMATGDYFDEAIKLAKKEGFFEQIGIHCNLTQGTPLTQAIRRCPRFVSDGRFNKRYDRALPLSEEEEEAIARELTAQIERLMKAGVRITHADSHHHIHIGEYTAPIVLRVCAEHGIRRFRNLRNLSPEPVFTERERRCFDSLMTEWGAATTENFGYLKDVAEKEIPDDTEILVHPDYDKNGILIDRRGMRDGMPIGCPIPDLKEEKGIVPGCFREI